MKKKIDRWKELLGIIALLVCSCSLNLAGTTEEGNAFARRSSSNETTSSSSSAGVPSSSQTVPQPVSSSSTESGVFDNPDYWYSYHSGDLVSMRVETSREDGVYVSYDRGAPEGMAGEIPPVIVLAISVEGESDAYSSDAYSDMKNWTTGFCVMVTSDAPVVMKIGLPPEVEESLGGDVPELELVSSSQVGNLLILCKSWDDFKQKGFGPVSMSGMEAFEQMTSLIFEIRPKSNEPAGEFKLSEIYDYGSGLVLDANVDGTDITINH
ncbi:hypothetical protein [Fibrobacter succinogenes]|uniref:hypothetical protein n=1 Tax=Fibrobacter succinogenes TaxID=833 RepID=UPI001562FE48|nr:hypothetical protein [Fibrobacter succinogenes]